MKTQHLYELIWMSRPLMQAAEACVEKGLSSTNLTVRMRAVLEMLHTHGDMTVPDIAAKIEINRQYVQVMVNETLTSGFLKQCPNPRHKRSPLLTLTDQGREVISAVMSNERELMHDMSAGLTDEELSIALDIVRKVATKLKAYAGTTKR